MKRRLFRLWSILLTLSPDGTVTALVYPGTPMDTVVYTYGDPDWGDLLTAYDGQAITYDAIGNPLTFGDTTYTWRHGRQLASFTNMDGTWRYSYGIDGLRTTAAGSDFTYEYTYTGGKLSMMKYNGETVYFTYDAAGTPVSMITESDTYYYVTNLQGDVVAILDSSGTQVVAYSYDAWGNHLSMSGSLAYSIGQLNPLRYRGYVYDQETGLYYLQSRYYNPRTGRFLNADAFAATGQGLLGNNMFAYCLNGPVSRMDSDGRDAIWVHESGSAGEMGHAGLLVEDENGNWYFFYWGPTNESFSPDLITGTGVNMIYIKVDVGDENLKTVKGVKNVLKNNDRKGRSKATTDILYLEGDYTPTHKYLSNLNTKYEKNSDRYEYTLLDDNCVYRTWKALGRSNRVFKDHSHSIVPDFAFMEAFALTSGKLFEYHLIRSSSNIIKEAVYALLK